MKKGTKVLKIIIDLFMAIVMIILLSTKITGLTWHEILGIAIGVAFITHIILNFKWISSITKNLFNRNISVKVKIKYILDILLGVFMITDIVLGILISKVLFPNINIQNRAIIVEWHKFCAYWMLIIMSIHIGFHWNDVVNALNKIIKEAKDSIFIKVILKVIYAVVGVLGIIGLMKQSINKNLTFPSTDLQNNFQKSTTMKMSENATSEKPTSTNNSNNTTNTNNADTQNDTENSNNSESSTNKKNNTTSTNNNSSSSSLSTANSLDEYLGNLHCTGCGRHCILTSPQCNVGASQAQQEMEKYNQSTSTSSSQDSSTTSNPLTNNKSSSTISSISSTDAASISEITKPDKAGMPPSMSSKDSAETNTKSNAQSKIANSQIPNNQLSSNNEEATITDYITIMGFFIGGTYYILKVIESAKNKKIAKNQNSTNNNYEKNENKPIETNSTEIKKDNNKKN